MEETQETSEVSEPLSNEPEKVGGVIIHKEAPYLVPKERIVVGSKKSGEPEASEPRSPVRQSRR